MLGFVAGAVFWHLVGFWSFVNEAVFHKRADGLDVAAAKTARTSVKAQSRQEAPGADVSAASEGCTLISRERPSGQALTAACVAHVGKFQPSRGVQRSDYADFGRPPVPTLISSTPSGQAAPAVSGWSARVDKLAAPSDPVVAP